jgi:ABC-type glycerol-3-phosphate transport system substrate-binding protein
MKCREVSDLLIAYLDGEVTPSERVLIQAHLTECAACRKDLDALAEAQARISRFLQRRAVAATPSPQSWRSLQAKLRQESQSPVRGFLRRLRQWRSRITAPDAFHKRPAVILATSLLVVMLVLLLAWPQARAMLAQATRAILAPYWESTQRGTQGTPLPSPVPTVLTLEETAVPSLPTAPSPTPTAQTSDREGTIITFACWEQYRGEYADLAFYFERVNPGVQVQIISIEETTGDLGGVEQLAAVADTFVWIAWDRPGEYRFLLDLRPFVDEPSFSAEDFFPSTLDHFRWQQGIYGLPAYVIPLSIFYDRTAFDQAGLDYPQAGWTWDDLLAAATQLTEREGDEVTRYGFVDHSFRHTVLAMMEQHNVALWDERTDSPHPLFDSPGVAEVLRRYTVMVHSEEVLSAPEAGPGVISDTINAGKAAMWTGFADDRRTYAQRANLGVVPYPEEVDAASPRIVYGFFISAGTAHPEVAWRWLSYLSENYLLSVEGIVPGRDSLAEQLNWWDKLDEETRSTFEYALAYPVTIDRPLNRIPLRKALEAVLDGTSIEEALRMAQAEALEIQAELMVAPPPNP